MGLLRATSMLDEMASNIEHKDKEGDQHKKEK